MTVNEVMSSAHGLHEDYFLTLSLFYSLVFVPQVTLSLINLTFYKRYSYRLGEIACQFSKLVLEEDPVLILSTLMMTHK